MTILPIIELTFEEIDNILDFLPKDINKIIYSWYDDSCKNCEKKMVFCNDCENFYCHSYKCVKKYSCKCCLNLIWKDRYCIEYDTRDTHNGHWSACQCHKNNVAMCANCWYKFC